MQKTTKSPTYAVMPHRKGMQDVYFLHIEKKHQEIGKPVETLKQAYQRPCFPVELRDEIISVLAKAGITVRYFDEEESKWMDISETGGLEPAPGQRDGSWASPSIEDFKSDYLRVRFGAAAA